MLLRIITKYIIIKYLIWILKRNRQSSVIVNENIGNKKFWKNEYKRLNRYILLIKWKQKNNNKKHDRITKT